ncbi:MAG: RpiB/LacA/LacB family sugar-phosphate isomerase [Thermoguttaceae bacterium]
MVQITPDIERIIREVLADLGLSPQSPCACTAPAEATSAIGPAPAPSSLQPSPAPVQPPAPAPLPTPARPSGDLVVADRVVTLAALGDRLAAARRLLVPPRAVVTPAVRDELRRRNVLLVVAEPNVAGSTAAGQSGRIVVTVLGSRIDPKPLVDELESSGAKVEIQRFDCLIRATNDMAARLVDTGAAGVLLTNYGAVAMCLANRHQGVRAVLASDEARTAEDAASVGANLLVVEPRRLAPEAMRQIVTAFGRQGPGRCPEALRERLA